MRTVEMVTALGLAACGGEVARGNPTDGSASLSDAALFPDGATDRDGGLESSACTFAGFDAPTSYSTAYPPSSMFVYSPTDGAPNVVAVEPGAVPNPTFELFANRGNGGFALAHFQGAMGNFAYAVAADFDGDGLADIAGVSLAIDGGVLQIDRNLGGGAFAAQLATYVTPQSTGYLAVGDFDRNGHPDIAMAGVTLLSRPDGETISSWGLDIFFNDGHGSFGNPVVYPDSQGYARETIAAADFDGDGSLDLGLFPGGLFLNAGEGTFGAELPLPAVPGDGGDASDVSVSSEPSNWAVGDFNRDGKADLVASIAPNEIGVFLAVGGGLFATPVTYLTNSTPSVVAVGDFNRDSYPDVVVLLDGQTASSSLGLHLNQGDGTFGAETTLALGPYAGSISVADFNGDGVTDMAVTHDVFPFPDGGAPKSFTVVLSQCR